MKNLLSTIQTLAALPVRCLRGVVNFPSAFVDAIEKFAVQK